ncbi:hypothetical protein [Streptosporangium sp. KLBMP 9127]|nr:hypothetical protein [Streptosporangium sp. KLBMP 9127]
MTSGAQNRRRTGERRPKDGTPAEAGAGPPSGEDPPIPSAPRKPVDGPRYEALGRVMAVLATEAELIESCRDLMWWPGPDGSWHIEWRDGPLASEVATLLAGHVRDPALADTPVVLGEPAARAFAEVDVLGVRFVLRAIDPLGRERVLARRSLWRLREALDTTRSTTARHPWEELLGG